MVDHEKSKMIITYVLFCLNVLTWLVSLILIGICLWVRFDHEVAGWVQKLELQQFYTGLYILIFVQVCLIASGFLSCISTFSENKRLLSINIIVHLVLFVLGLIGAAVLMENSTLRSSIHEAIRKAMVGLIQLYPSYQPANYILSTIQESVGCCGGEGYSDYFNHHRPLPSECRNSVTGNTHYHGCADAIPFILEGRSSWITGLTLVLCAKKVLNAVLSAILVHLIEITEDV